MRTGWVNRAKSRPVQAIWCSGWHRTFHGRNLEAVSCQLNKGHDGPHKAEVRRKHSVVELEWDDEGSTMRTRAA